MRTGCYLGLKYAVKHYYCNVHKLCLDRRVSNNNLWDVSNLGKTVVMTTNDFITLEVFS